MIKQAFIRSIIVFILLFIFTLVGKTQEFWMGSYSPGALSASSICYNAVPSSISSASAVGGSGSFTYQWYKDEGSGYALWAAAGTGLNPIAAMTTGATVYRNATDPSTGWTANTNPVAITVGVSINTSYTLNGATPICSGSSTTMSISGSQSGFTYQLRDDADNSVKATKDGTGGAIGFDAVSPSASKTYNVLAVENATSCSAELVSLKSITVEFPISNNTITSPNSDECSGSGFTIVASAASGTGITYQWQKSTTSSSSGFANITGATSQNYSTSITDTTWYRRIANSTSAVCGTSSHTSNTVQKSVIPAITNNTITTSPFTTCYNSVPAAISADAASGGSGTAAYLWEYSTAGPSSGFSAAPGSNTGQNYTPSVAIIQTTWYRRRVVKGCIDYSPALQVSVYSEIASTAPTISRQGNQVGKYTQTVTSPVSTGGNGTRYYRFTLKRGSTTVTGPTDWQAGRTYNFAMTSANTITDYYVVVESYTSDCPDDIAISNTASWTHAACGTTTGDGNFTYYYGGTCYMIAQTDEVGTYEWGCDGTSTNINDINDGEANTNALAALECSSGSATRQCYDSNNDSFTNWYLPTHNQYEYFMNPNESTWGLSGNYWSSREYHVWDQPIEHPTTHAWFATFSHPSQLMQVTAKDVSLKARCIRNAYE